MDPKYRANAGNGSAIALAPTRTFEAGVGARPTFGDFTPFASIRVKSIADRPATEDGSLVAQGFTVVDANAGLRWKAIEAGLDVQNLFDTKWREVNFAAWDTRLPYEPKVVSGIHYSPGWPFTAIGRVDLPLGVLIVRAHDGGGLPCHAPLLHTPLLPTPLLHTPLLPAFSYPVCEGRSRSRREGSILRAPTSQEATWRRLFASPLRS